MVYRLGGEAGGRGRERGGGGEREREREKGRQGGREGAYPSRASCLKEVPTRHTTCRHKKPDRTSTPVRAILHPLHPTPYTLYTLHPTPSTPYTLHPIRLFIYFFCAQHPTRSPETPANPHALIPNPQPPTLNPCNLHAYTSGAPYGSRQQRKQCL
jgi:hypothetical protein